MGQKTESSVEFQDQSENSALQQAEVRYERLMQLYAVLTHCNQAIVRCNNEQELLNEICKIAVHYGGMKMAWVGRIDETERHITPVAAYGEGTQILDGIQISVDETNPYGNGPSGTAIRKNQPFWCQDFTNDPRLAPWHELIAPYNWHATATVPLCQNGKAIGALSMYSHQTNAFDEAARDLLVRVGQDISYALDIYVYEAEHRHHEELLRGESLESLSQRDAALREITQGVLIANANRVITYVNDAFTRKTGYTREDILGRHCTILHGPETSTETRQHIKKLLDAGQPYQGEILNYRKDGSPFWNDLSITPVFNENEELVQWVGIQRDITQRKQDEARIRRLNNLYAALSHCNHTIVHCKSEQELFEQICHGAVEYGGLKLAWIGMLGKADNPPSITAFYGEGPKYLESLNEHMKAEPKRTQSPTEMAIHMNQPIWCQDFLKDPLTSPWHKIAEQYGIRAMAALPLHRNGTIVGNFTLYADTVNAFDEEARKLLLEMAQDVGFALGNFEREAARQKVEEELRLAANVFEQSQEAISIADANLKFVMINKAFTEITGYTEEEILGKKVRFRHHAQNNDVFFQTIGASIRESNFWQGEYWNKRKNGEAYLERLSIKRILDDDGEIAYSIGIFSDITESRKTEDRMHWLSHFDSLTGLPNRTLLEDRCQQAINKAMADKEPLALMFLDLDHFKNINDSIGHRAGDLLLTELANRLTAIAREQDTLSRLGGDDFVLMLPGTNSETAAHFAQEIIATTAQTFMIEEHEVNISCSIGIAMYPTAGEDFESLIKCADMAMFRAKDTGRNTFCFFTAEIQTRLVRSLQLENALRLALERNQLTLHYQPQVSMKSGAIIGLEALLRWHHPEFGAVSPAEFIPIAESCGLILPIGDWVIRTAAKQLKIWLDSEFPSLTMSVNVSALQFRQPEFPSQVMQILKEIGLPSEFLELELTESATMEDPHTAIQVMNELNQYGIRISIDDFGTGYSSLAYLKRFNIHKLKIDQSFVQDILVNADDRAIVNAVIRLAGSLGMKTVAEGVETAEQKAYLNLLRCDEFQGYYFSKPLPADQIELLLRHNRE